MNVDVTVSKARDFFKQHGYELFFGQKSRYNTKREATDREVILEPFPMRPSRSGVCAYDTNLTFWVGMRRSVDTKFRDNADGQLTDWMQYMLSETSQLLMDLYHEDWVLIHQNINDIELRYYEADEAATVNSQSFIRFSIPVKLYVN